MRLSPYQIEIIRRVVSELAGEDAQVRLFGSRVDDSARGGDIDLLVEIKHAISNPAWLSAQIAGRISYRMGGRKVDVLLSGPNLRHFSIHDVARGQGIVL